LQDGADTEEKIIINAVTKTLGIKNVDEQYKLFSSISKQWSDEKSQHKIIDGVSVIINLK